MKKYEKPNKKARSLMLLQSVTVGVVFTIIAVIVWIILRYVGIPFSPNWIFALLAALWIIELVSPFVRYERLRYCFSDEEINIREGFIFVTEDIVPIERLHKIATNSGPYDRLFKLAKVEVTTAGGDVEIPFLEVERAEAIVENLKKKINGFAVESRQLEAAKKAELEWNYENRSGTSNEGTDEEQRNK